MGKDASPKAEKMAESMGVDLKKVKGSGTNGKVLVRDIRKLPIERTALNKYLKDELRE